MSFYTYIVASRRNGTIYIGSTDDIIQRVFQHKQRLKPDFTSRYDCTLLVWYEVHETRAGAFRRERQLKEWRRSWKLMLLKERNPTWRDLYDDLETGRLPL